MKLVFALAFLALLGPAFAKLIRKRDARTPAEPAKNIELKNAVRNNAFCKDFFNPSVRKQLIYIKLIDLPNYVDIKDMVYTKEDGTDAIVIFGKDKLIVLLDEDSVNKQGSVERRNTYRFKEFINSVNGKNCLTNIIEPFVIVLCEASTTVFKQSSNGSYDGKEYPVAFPGLSIAGSPLFKDSHTILKLTMFQKVPEGVMWSSKDIPLLKKTNTVFEDTLAFAYTESEMAGLVGKTVGGKRGWYFTQIGRSLKYNGPPTPEGKAQWKLGPPLIQLYNGEFLFINLTSTDAKMYAMVNNAYDAREMVGTGFAEVWWCYFPKNGDFYTPVSSPKPSPSPSPNSNSSSDQTDKKKSSTVLIVVLSTLLIFGAVVAVGGYLYLKKTLRKDSVSSSKRKVASTLKK